MNQRGFSLIELVIVIAIMAILVAVIAPNLTSYLGSSKVETDERNIDEVRHQVLNCISEAATKGIDVIDVSSGSTKAVYELVLNTSTNKTEVKVVTDGVVDFAEILTVTLEDATAGSSKDKTKNKMKIEISKESNQSYIVSISYIS